ncbi:hypothetical protein [Streptomyces sp. NPDC056632]|uniref:hypothetical protein n=1 Tax=Streptomyces sp. NPDC056632 TaxID=3345884 RepID=UPI003680D477
MRDPYQSPRGCLVCDKVRSSNGAPTIVVAVIEGQDVFACADHQAELSMSVDDVIRLAQYQDMARRRAVR